jgi:hypothetical protein
MGSSIKPNLIFTPTDFHLHSISSDLKLSSVQGEPGSPIEGQKP